MIGVIKEVFSANIKYMQIMDEKGNVDAPLFPKELSDQKLLEMLKLMMLTRNVDAKAVSLQRQGRSATYAPSLGEEAVNIGTAMALRKDDIFVPAFRQHGVYIARSLPIHLFYLYWMGFEEGNVMPPEVRGFPMAVPVSTQMPHAAGIAFAQKYKKNRQCGCCLCGRRRHFRRRLLRSHKFRRGMEGASCGNNTE